MSKKVFIERLSLIEKSKKYSNNIKIIKDVEEFIKNIAKYYRT